MSDTKKITNILFCGVGGQGVILASNVASKAALEAGFDVKKSEIHGMAQRGGNVDSHVRFGEKVYSPLIPAGETDFLVSFELVEPLRWTELLNKDTTMFINSQKIHSLSTATGLAEYPEGVADTIKQNFPNAVLVDVLSIARKLGNERVINTIMLGMLAKKLPQIPKEVWLDVLKKSLKPKIIDVNMEAFETGYNLIP